MQRAEVLAALSQRAAAGRRGVWVLIQAVDRLREPGEVETSLMLTVAIVGALANTAGLLMLRRGQAESLNVRGAYLEVLDDLLGSVAVIVAAMLIMLTGWTRFDAIASLLIFALIVPRAWSLLREVVDVLLEATPRGVDLDQVREHIRGVSGVVDVHDLHVWTITSGVPVLSAHVVVDEACISEGRSGEVLDQLAECLGGHFDVEHCTFQLEPLGHQDHEAGIPCLTRTTRPSPPRWTSPVAAGTGLRRRPGRAGPGPRAARGPGRGHSSSGRRSAPPSPTWPTGASSRPTPGRWPGPI